MKDGAMKRKASERVMKNDVSELYRGVTTEPKKSEKSRRKQKGVQRNVFRRPIVCPPDGAGRGLGIRIAGYLSRVFVLLFAVFGLSFFICDAFKFHYVAETLNKRGQTIYYDVTVTGTIFLAALLSVVILSAIAIFRRARIPSLGGAVVILGISAIAIPQFFAKLYAVAVTVVNSMLSRLHAVNYFTLIRTVKLPETGLSEEFLVRGAAALLTVVIAAVFVPCLIRKMHLLPPAIFSAVFIAFIFICNISRSNWAFVLLLSSFAALIVMWAYDKLYQREASAEEYDTTAVLIPEDGKPTLSAEAEAALLKKDARRVEKRKARAEARARRRENKENRAYAPQKTVDEELTDYFGSGTSSQSTRLTPEEKKAEAEMKKRRKAAERIEEKSRKAAEKAGQAGIDAELKRYRDYVRVTVDSRAAAGGFAGLAAFLLMMILLFIPAISVERSFTTIPAINDRLEYCREYVTALLVGNEDVLDRLDYECDSKNTSDRSVALIDRYYTGEKLFTVRSRAIENIYLKGWIGVDYENGAWQGANDEALEAYREAYALQDYPAERVTEDFYRLMLSDKLRDPSDDSVDWEKRRGEASSYGVIQEKISVRRLSEEIGSLLYLPTAYSSRFGLRNYESIDPSELHFVNYFDGILTGKEFRDLQEYSSLAYVTTMQDRDFMENLSLRIAKYNANLTLTELYEEGYFTDKEVNPEIVDTPLYEVDPEETGKRKGPFLRSATYAPLDCTVESYYDENGKLEATLVVGEYGRLEATSTVGDGTEIFALFRDYIETMTKAEKQELSTAFADYEAYRAHVYATYLDTAVRENEEGIREGSEILSSLSDGLAKDFTLFDSADGGSLDASDYVTRHKFVMHVIDYMKENTTYLEPDEKTHDIVVDRTTLAYDDSLDAVENFLTVSKQGYCVQYASALCLLLREQGIPARYVEGYVAGDQHRDRTIRGYFVYEGDVRDYDLHAWVEVWYDGIGWIQYEATPGEYYDGMYPWVETPGLPDDPKPQPTPDDPIEEPEPEDPTEGMSEEELEEYLAALKRAELIRKLIRYLILLGIVLLLVAVVLVIRALALRKEKARDDLIRKAKAGQFSDEERRAVALRVIDEMNALLSLYGLAPETGELREDYADRLLFTMPAIFGQIPKIEGDESSVPSAFTYEIDARRALMSIAAEEFGGGMSRAELKDVAELYSRLRTVKRRFVPPVRRFTLRYFGHKL